jgi:hypothetical protein
MPLCVATARRDRQHYAAGQPRYFDSATLLLLPLEKPPKVAQLYAHNRGRHFAAALVVAMSAGYATPAAAQATRTWVAGTGDDANPCSRTAPCKTFVGAHNKTAAGGEINCLGSGGFGGITITKAISIICEGVVGGVLASGGVSAITVNAGAADNVYLSGLDILGTSGATSSVRFVAGAAVHIHRSTIRGSTGQGVQFAPTGASELYITDTVIAMNGTPSAGGGVLVQPQAAGTALVSLRNAMVQNNGNYGLRIDTNGNTGTFNTVSVYNTEIDGNQNGISVANPAGTAAVGLMIVRSTIVGNGYGIAMSGAGVVARVSDTTITGNANGVFAGGGSSLLSFGDNLLEGNPTAGRPADGAFTGSATKK